MHTHHDRAFFPDIWSLGIPLLPLYPNFHPRCAILLFREFFSGRIRSLTIHRNDNKAPLLIFWSSDPVLISSTRGGVPVIHCSKIPLGFLRLLYNYASKFPGTNKCCLIIDGWVLFKPANQEWYLEPTGNVSIRGTWKISRSRRDTSCVFKGSEINRIWGKQWMTGREAEEEDSGGKMEERQKEPDGGLNILLTTVLPLAWREAVAITRPVKNETDVHWCRRRSQMSGSNGRLLY